LVKTPEILEEENNGYVVVKYVSRNQLADRAVVRGKVALLPSLPISTTAYIQLKAN
jgi:hypothetical protein